MDNSSDAGSGAGSAPRQVFISHASEDSSKALALVRRLESSGTACWIAPRDIKPSDDYREAILRAIDTSDAMVVLVSREAVESPHVAREVHRAVGRGSRMRILPVRIEQTRLGLQLEYDLGVLQWIDAHEGDFSEYLDRIAGVLGVGSPEVESKALSTGSDSSTTLLHTADWHIGKGFHRFADMPEIQHRLRGARLDAIDRVGDCAREVGAAAVLVAGDLFHTSEVPDSVVVEALDRIGRIGVPVIAIPGNHDHAGEGTVWRRQSFERHRKRAPNLEPVLDGPTCVEIEGVDVLAMPVRQRMHRPVVAELGQLEGRSGVARVGLVHGATDDFSEDGESRAIQWLGEAEARLDYLALGDYHRQQEVLGGHCLTWYAGTIEPDGFASHGQVGDRRGSAVRIDVHGPGQIDVTPVPLVGGMRWVRLKKAIQDEGALAQFERQLLELASGAAQSVLCQLDLSGSRLGYAAAARLDALIERERAVFCALERRGDVSLIPDEGELLNLRELGGIAGEAARVLYEKVERPDDEGAVAREALQQLYSLTIGAAR